MNAPVAIGDHIRAMKTREQKCAGESCSVVVEQYYFLHRWTPEHCPNCAAAERDRRQMSREQRTKVEREQAGKAALRDLRVPKLYANVSLDSFRLHGDEEPRTFQRRVLQFGRDYVADWPDVGEDRMLVTLRGGTGTGKGHWAWSVCKAVATEHAAAVAFVRLPDLIRELRASWSDKSERSEDQVLNWYRKKDLLFIDEVSRHAFYGQGFQHLLDVVDHRVNDQRPTILTTNDDNDSLAEILGPANMSRLNGCGGIVEFGTEDYRMRDREAA